jgi:hypothetical protein
MTVKTRTHFTTIFILTFLNCFSQSTAIKNKRTYTTKSISHISTPKIDGILDDKVWSEVEWQGDFIEYNPDNNTKPSFPSKFKIVYDEKFLYVAIRSYDNSPEKIEKRLSRRDGFAGDWVEINLDTNNDKRTAFSFTATAAGVKGDEFISENGNNWDSSWNPIWYTAATIDEEGWISEIKIPFSQLKFGSSDEQIWGLQVKRRFFRNNERSLWQKTALDATGWVSEFGVLRGLFDIKPQKQLEIQPFTVSKYDSYPKEEGNPFKDGKDFSFNGGVDAKIGITNDLTLDLTINPDFGQVEADPGNIALDGFQVFLKEQRPFFVENKNIFDFEFGNGSDNLFYSRRIGRNPQGSITYNEDSNFIDKPDNTTILGAVKFSGKTKSGWSIGLLESVTANEFATIENANKERRSAIVEPTTNYLVARIQKDFNDRNTYIGGIFTAVNRNLGDDFGFDYDSELKTYTLYDSQNTIDPFSNHLTENNLNGQIHKAAYSGGIDFKHNWKDRKYYVLANLVASHVNGTKEAILKTQESQRHLFNRADASHVDINQSKTSLSGYGGKFEIGKAGGGNWTYRTGANWYSPELELNDIGFLRQADFIKQYVKVRYKFLKPTRTYRSANINLEQFTEFDFEGNFNRFSSEINGFINWKNNWWTESGTGFTPHNFSNSHLRGGERWRLFDDYFAFLYFGSDQSKKFNFILGYVTSGAEQNNDSYIRYDFRLNYQPTDALNISLRTKLELSNNKTQYVTDNTFQNDKRYILGNIDLETWSTTLRMNYSINPNLSIQYYGQPFIARGKYSDFNFVNNPTARDFNDRVTLYKNEQISFDESDYSIDENTDGTIDYSFDDPNFSEIQFRSNLVVRWEYIPGSELFFVWTQGIDGSDDPKQSIKSNFQKQVFNRQPNNTFLIKATYRFIL